MALFMLALTWFLGCLGFSLATSEARGTASFGVMPPPSYLLLCWLESICLPAFCAARFWTELARARPPESRGTPGLRCLGASCMGSGALVCLGS